MSFASDLRKFRETTLGRLDRVRRGSILELFTLVIDATPVDTGRARGNWQTTVGQPAQGVVDRRGSSVAIAEVVANLGSLSDVVFMVNNLPYIERLEYDGWSAQAPAGMMRRNIVRWPQIVEARAKAEGIGAFGSASLGD